MLGKTYTKKEKDTISLHYKLKNNKTIQEK